MAEHLRRCACGHVAFNHTQAISGSRYRCMERGCDCRTFCEPDTLSVRAIQTLNQARSDRWMAGSPGWTTLEVAGELAGEAGELAEVVLTLALSQMIGKLANTSKKLRRSEMGVPGNKLSDAELRAQARGELADVFIVLMLTASKLGIDLEDAVRETFNRKSEQMGFPERIAGRKPDERGASQ